MKHLFFATIAAVVLCGASASAQAIFKTGNDILSDCKSDRSANYGLCLGYIEGVADVRNITAKETVVINGKTEVRRHACIRDGVTAGQLKDVVLKWLEDNPQLRDLPASGAVSVAVVEGFPC